ncbi:MAG: alpha/beta fold hydrolase [Bdellovibrionales bacterium]
MAATPTTIFVVHGTCGSASGNWFPWLKSEMERKGCRVIVPQFPTPEGQSFAAWRGVFRDSLGDCDPANTILIGHSIGAPFVMRMAEEAEQPYRAMILVCPFAKTLGIAQFDTLNASFVEHDFDWSQVRKGASMRVCFAADDDPYVPLALSQDVAAKMDATLIVIPKGGHLNADSGYTSFPPLLNTLALAERTPHPNPTAS